MAWRQAVRGPLGVPVAVKVHAAGELIASHRGWTEDLGELARSDPAPEIDLEETVRGGNVSLGEEQIVHRGSVYVWDAPAVTEDFDLLLQASDVDRISGECPAERQGKGKCAFHAGHSITPPPYSGSPLRRLSY
jgi:hypothetical protein